jgi:hypothetical protein
VRRVLEQAVERVEHLVREQEEELSARTSKSMLVIRLHTDQHRPDTTHLDRPP